MQILKRHLVFVLWAVIQPGFAQEVVFRRTDPQNDAFRMKAVKNDKVIIQEDSAYIYSTGMVEKIAELQQRYLACLSEREADAQRVEVVLSSLNRNFTDVGELLDRSSAISHDQVETWKKQMDDIIGRLEHDIASLRELEREITEAESHLAQVRKEVKRERSRLWWKKTGSIFAAALAGLAAGFIIGTAAS
jgi:septation ring formation regulator EzrA